MVQTFQTITGALQEKKRSSDKNALTYAAQTLAQNTTSGSGQLYAQNLSQAASQIQGKKVDAQGALQLLQTLIGSGQAGQPGAGPAAGGDALGSLLGGLAGGQAPAQGAAPAGGADILGSLLGGLAGGQASNAGAQQGGLDAGNLLAAGMAFLQAKQGGQGNVQALVQAFTAGSGMGNSTHRTQSTQLVVNSFLQALGGQK